jgi:hypothetical protein
LKTVSSNGLTIIPAAKKPRSPPFSRRARVLRILPGQFGKLLRRLLNLLEDLFRPAIRPFSLFGPHHQDQDVARAPLFGLLVTILVTFVPGTSLRHRWHQLRHQAFERETDILDLGLFRHFEALDLFSS